jgi:hypothetical protein
VKYVVKTGEYPFEEVVGFVDAPADDAAQALERALRTFGHVAAHPVVEPFKEPIKAIN